MALIPWSRLLPGKFQKKCCRLEKKQIASFKRSECGEVWAWRIRWQTGSNTNTEPWKGLVKYSARRNLPWFITEETIQVRKGNVESTVNPTFVGNVFFQLSFSSLFLHIPACWVFALDKWLCQNTKKSHRKQTQKSSKKRPERTRRDVENAGAVFLIFSTAVKRENLWHPETGYLFRATAGLLLEFANKSNETGEIRREMRSARFPRPIRNPSVSRADNFTVNDVSRRLEMTVNHCNPESIISSVIYRLIRPVRPKRNVTVCC